VGHAARARRTGAQDITVSCMHRAAKAKRRPCGSCRAGAAKLRARHCQARAGYVECGLSPHSPRAADHGRRTAMTVNARRRRSAGAARARTARKPCTRRDRAAQDRRLKERRRSHRARSRVACVNRLRSIASAGKNAPLGKKRIRPRCRLHFSCCNCRARQGNCLQLRRMHVGAKNLRLCSRESSFVFRSDGARRAR
jgi:hypothetical protein